MARNGEVKISSRNLKSFKLKLLHIHSARELQPPSKNFDTCDVIKILTKKSSVKDLEKSS